MVQKYPQIDIFNNGSDKTIINFILINFKSNFGGAM